MYQIGFIKSTKKKVQSYKIHDIHIRITIINK